MLSLWDFREREGVCLDMQCISVLYARTAHLKDRDFVQLDRPILELIGFKNKMKTCRNKVEDNRNDFSHAIRCLKNTTGFVQGSSLEDESADFVLLLTSTLAKTNSTLIEIGRAHV